MSNAIFQEIHDVIKNEGKQYVKKVRGVIQFKIKGGDDWVVDLKNGNGSVYKGTAKNRADMTLTVSSGDFVKMSSGSLNAQQAFMQGKIKIKGNMGLAMKLGEIMKAVGR
eukprot:GSMAST32.ASY1.ANO1.1239.1 assembled CDS